MIFSLFLFLSCSENNQGSIEGTASADDGNVVSGITVKLYTENTKLLDKTQTDNEGNFVFTGLDSGNYYIGATVTINGEVWDTGNTPRIIYVGDEIVEIVSLTLPTHVSAKRAD